MKIRSKSYPKTIKSGWNIITIKIILLHTSYSRKLGQSSCGARRQKNNRLKVKKRKLFLSLILFYFGDKDTELIVFIFAQP